MRSFNGKHEHTPYQREAHRAPQTDPWPESLWMCCRIIHSQSLG